MASLNEVRLIGNVTRDIDLKYTPAGAGVCEVSIAVNHKYKNGAGEYVEEVTYVDVALFGKTAELAAQYLSKGSSVFFGGRLKLDTWEKDGKKNYKLRVIGENMQFLGGKGGSGGGDSGPRRTNTERQDEPRQQQRSTQRQAPPQDDDLPF